MKPLVACTIVAANYWPAARVLRDSFQRQHPEIALRVLFVGTESQAAPARSAGLDLLLVEDLSLPDWPRRRAQYDPTQVLTSLKPALLHYLLAQGHQAAMYLDADIWVTADLRALLSQVQSHALCLTPHLLPLGTARAPVKLETSLLFAGIYNAGFVGASQTPATIGFLNWWAQRLATHCRKDKKRALNYDQRWLDLAPSLVADTCLVHDPGCNFGPWRFPSVTLTRDGEGYLVDGQPLRFAHFSGFDPHQPDQVSRHLRDFDLRDGRLAPELFHNYSAALRAAGWDQAIQTPWPWPKRWWRR